MAVGMRLKKRGLFGSGMQPSGVMPQPQVQPGLGMQNPMQEEKRPGLGTRILGEGWEDKAIALGSALQGNQNAIPQFMAQQNAIQQRAAMMAEQQRQASMEAAQENAQWYERENWKRENPMPVNNDTERDLDLMQQRLTPQQYDQYLQNNYINPSFYTGPDGRRYPNPTGGAAPQRPVGKLTPLGTNAENGPMRASNTSLTRAQFNAIAEAYGSQEKAREHVRKYNIQVID